MQRPPLTPLQELSVQYLCSQQGVGLLALPMGQGKTRACIEALARLAPTSQLFPLLLLAPVMVHGFWADSLRAGGLVMYTSPDARRTQDQRRQREVAAVLRVPRNVLTLVAQYAKTTDGDLLVVRSQHDVRTRLGPHTKVLLATYDTVKKSTHSLRALRFRTVVLDESQMLAKTENQRSLALAPLVRRAQHRIFLTGTPARDRPRDLWLELHLLYPHAFPSFADFGQRFCLNPAKRQCVDDQQKYSGFRDLDVLHQWLQDSKFWFRRQGPAFDVTRTCRWLVGGAPPSPALGADPIRTYQQVVQDKLPLLRLYLERVLASLPTKTVFFANSRAALDLARELCLKHGLGFVAITGATPPRQREALAARFQTSADVALALLSLGACSVATTLTASAHVHFLDLTWRGWDLRQAEFRVLRLGQARSVKIYYVLWKHSFEARVWHQVSSKINRMTYLHDKVYDFERFEHEDIPLSG